MNDFDFKWPSFSPSKNSMKVLHLNEKNIEILDYKDKISMNSHRFWLCQMTKTLNLLNMIC